jgi:hypothetical protein
VKRIEKLDWYLLQIAQLWPDFRDDGLSWFPDWIYRRWDLHLAGRVHDWHYCSRCHKQYALTDEKGRVARRFADRALRVHSCALLPWWLPATPFILFYGVRLGGPSSWDSCGDDAGEWCRHMIARPVWMR